MSRWVVAVALVAATGCEKKEPRFEGPLRVDFGDCASAQVRWVSGPRPEAFTAEQADSGKVAAADPAAEPHPQPADTNGGAFASLTGTGDIGSGFDDQNIYGGLLGNEVGEMQGGFGYGRAGFGPGGGGTGWGTIGTGKYGTIGHGAGTGLRGRSANVPTTSIGQPAAQGDLDKAIIRRYIKRNLQKLTYCYEKQLLVKPKLAGTVNAQFTIGANGSVVDSKASGLDPEVASCVAGVIKDIEFPKPKGAGVVIVKYPFTFRPAGSTDPAPAPASADPPPPDEPAKPADPPKPAPTKPYQPDAHDPLVARRAEIEECLRKNPRPYGAVVVQLDYDGSGSATQATVHGVDRAVAECIAKAAKGVKRATPGSGAQRCSLAFGDMPLDTLPAIDITSSAVVFGGKPMATLDAAMHEDGFKIGLLYEALDGERKAWSAPDAPVVAIRGPGVIRPVDATPMKIVNVVLGSVAVAAADYSLAALTTARPGQPATWQPLRAFGAKLPVIPVPVGTGGRWNAPALARDPSAAVADDERVNLSILVTKTTVWIGLSRVNEFQEIRRDGSEWDALAKALAAHKASAFFVDRSDVELAGEDEVTYRDVVTAFERARAAGFSDARVIHPYALSARPVQ
ncbi:MAG TPA: AgmX/PglI C-terminal domain-containing protein [Kofleriaceae bacterium]|nr:AgmX/PglI C-terminal domain-containing protein [Kofleriaceae bacterium]